MDEQNVSVTKTQVFVVSPRLDPKPVVVVPARGWPGSDGPEGPPGPPGPEGPQYTGFVHTQSTAAATWIVTHTLGRYPNAAQVVIGGEVVYADVTYPNITTVVVAFPSPQTGALRLT